MQDITVTCLIACLDDAVDDSLASSVRDDMDLSCKIPAGLASSRPQLVVATLDINQGALFQLLRAGANLCQVSLTQALMKSNVYE